MYFTSNENTEGYDSIEKVDLLSWYISNGEYANVDMTLPDVYYGYHVPSQNI
jgi:hypothetical protein